MNSLGIVAMLFLHFGVTNGQEFCRNSDSQRPVFFVDIECTSQNLKINWKLDERRYLRDYVLHFTSTLFISCTNLSGKEIYNSSITEEQPERMAGSLSLGIRNISSCIAYGCHSYYGQQRLTENSTCSVGDAYSTDLPQLLSTSNQFFSISTQSSTQSEMLATIIPTIAKPPTTSQQIQSVVSTRYPSSAPLPQLLSNDPKSNAYSTDLLQLLSTSNQFFSISTQSSTQSEMLATIIPTIAKPPTTSQQIQSVVSTKHPVSTRYPSSAPLPQLLSNDPKSNSSLKYLWVFGSIGLLVIFLLGFIGCAFLINYTKARKKRVKHIALHWNLQCIEKTDLNFITLEVDQRLKKHESTTSIIECLNLPKKVNSETKEAINVSPQQPANNDQQFTEISTTITYPEKFVLDASEIYLFPPHNLLNETLSHETISSSHSQPYLENCGSSVSQGQNQVDLQSTRELDHKNASPPSDYYRDSFNQERQENETGNLTDISEDFDSVTQDEKASGNHSSYTTNNCVVLQFAPSSLTNSNEVIYLGSLPQTDNEQFCEDITEENFYIDPRHFNPL